MKLKGSRDFIASLPFLADILLQLKGLLFYDIGFLS